MITFRNARLVAGLLAALFFAAPASWAQPEDGTEGEGDRPGVVLDEIVAKVDDHIILRSEVERSYQSYLQQGNLPNEDMRCRILQDLVVQKMLYAQAEIDSVTVEDGEVAIETERRIQYILQRYGQSPAEVERRLGRPLSQIREELRGRIHEQLVVERMQQQITSEIDVTPAEVRRFYNRIPKDSLPYLPTEVEVAHIVHYPEVSLSEKQAVRSKLLGLRERILAGEDFGRLAESYSEDFGSSANGGDLGWVGRGDFVPAFEAVALRMAEGEIARPVESEFGYHLIQLLERRGDRYHCRHILIKPKASEADIEQGRLFLDSIRTRIVNDSVSFEIAAKRHSKDRNTKGTGGFFTEPGTNSPRVPDESLPAEIFFSIDTMQLGTISKPQQFRTEDGKPAFRIVYYKSSIPPHYANLRQDYQKIYAATVSSKRQAAIMDFLAIVKENLYIDIDPRYDPCRVLDF